MRTLDEDGRLRHALRNLLAQIEVSDYRDPLGHRLTMNIAYIEVVALLNLLDLLERDSPPKD